MSEALKCLNCGIRYLLKPEVVGDDGNPMAVDDVRVCMGCDRVYKIVEDGPDKVKLQLVIANTSMMSLRSL